jgi:hypothetical protein
MNLYQINVKHIAPKSSHTSIEEYILAENDSEVFDYISEEYTNWDELDGCERYITDFQDSEDYTIEDYERFMKEFIISTKGEIDSDWACYDDLFYGRTHYGWELLFENITEEQIKVLKLLNVL